MKPDNTEPALAPRIRSQRSQLWI